MLTTIIGWIWIVAGAFFFLKPQWLRTSLRKKGVKQARRLLFATALLAGLFLFGVAWDAGGVLGTIALVLGFVAILKAFFFLKGTVTERVVAWTEKQPLIVLRGIALAYVALGAILVLGIGRGAEAS